MVNEQLFSELATIAPFLLQDDPYTRVLSSSNIPFYIIDAMKRQIELGNDEKTFNILNIGLAIITHVQSLDILRAFWMNWHSFALGERRMMSATLAHTLRHC